MRWVYNSSSPPFRFRIVIPKGGPNHFSPWIKVEAIPTYLFAGNLLKAGLCLSVLQNCPLEPDVILLQRQNASLTLGAFGPALRDTKPNAPPRHSIVQLCRTLILFVVEKFYCPFRRAAQKQKPIPRYLLDHRDILQHNASPSQNTFTKSELHSHWLLDVVL